MKPAGPGLLFAGRFLIHVSISVLVMGLLRFSISSWFSLESCSFLRICPFFPCSFYWHIIADKMDNVEEMDKYLEKYNFPN